MKCHSFFPFPYICLFWASALPYTFNVTILISFQSNLMLWRALAEEMGIDRAALSGVNLAHVFPFLGEPFPPGCPALGSLFCWELSILLRGPAQVWPASQGLQSFLSLKLPSSPFSSSLVFHFYFYYHGVLCIHLPYLSPLLNYKVWKGRNWETWAIDSAVSNCGAQRDSNPPRVPFLTCYNIYENK